MIINVFLDERRQESVKGESRKEQLTFKNYYQT